MAHQSTTPWSVLGLIKEARTPAKEIQEVPWCVKTMGSSSSRVSYHGDMDVLLQANMAFTQGFVT